MGQHNIRYATAEEEHLPPVRVMFKRGGGKCPTLHHGLPHAAFQRCLVTGRGVHAQFNQINSNREKWMAPHGLLVKLRGGGGGCPR